MRADRENRRGQHHAQPTQEDADPAGSASSAPFTFSMPSVSLTVQNFMKYCRTVAAMNKQYTSE